MARWAYFKVLSDRAYHRKGATFGPRDTLQVMAEASPATHAVRLAAWLHKRESTDADDPDAVLAAAERTCQKLCTRLARLVTVAGCQSLLARAIHLAAAEEPFLRRVRAGAIPGPCLEGVQ
jgi:hypothetical protein